MTREKKDKVTDKEKRAVFESICTIGLGVLAFVLLIVYFYTLSIPFTKQKRDTIESPVGYCEIGQKVPVKYIQHNYGPNYELGIIDPNTKQIEWTYMSDSHHGNLNKVIYDDNITESYLLRTEDQKIPDPLSIMRDKYILQDKYDLYVASNEKIGAGETVERVGNGRSVREIRRKSEMIAQ